MHCSPQLVAAAKRCAADLDTLTLTYRQEVRRLAGYLPGTVSDDEIDATARDVLGLILRRLTGEDVSAELGERSRAIGRRRARQGLPLDSLLRAVRLDFRILWGALLAAAADAAAEGAAVRSAAAQRNPASEFAASSDVLVIWDTVEFHTNHVQSAYTDELLRLRRDSA